MKGYMDCVARMLGNTAKHYSCWAYTNIIASMHIGSEKNILGFGSPQLACVGVKPAALHVVRVVFERFGLMVHPRNHQRMLVEAVVSTDEHANVLSIHDCSRYTRHRRRGMPNN
jgi:hypothetical protein